VTRITWETAMHRPYQCIGNQSYQALINQVDGLLA
jgi:hypothetical protein